MTINANFDYFGAVTAQVGPVYKGVSQKGLLTPVRNGAGDYTITPDGATPLPATTVAACDVFPCMSLNSLTANINGGITQVGAPAVLAVKTWVAAAATDLDFIVWGIHLT